jgi:hypothetical protein
LLADGAAFFGVKANTVKDLSKNNLVLMTCFYAVVGSKLFRDGPLCALSVMSQSGTWLYGLAETPAAQARLAVLSAKPLSRAM